MSFLIKFKIYLIKFCVLFGFIVRVWVYKIVIKNIIIEVMVIISKLFWLKVRFRNFIVGDLWFNCVYFFFYFLCIFWIIKFMIMIM